MSIDAHHHDIRHIVEKNSFSDNENRILMWTIAALAIVAFTAYALYLSYYSNGYYQMPFEISAQGENVSSTSDQK